MIQEINKRKIPIVFTLHDYWLMCPGWHLLKKDCRPCTKAQHGKFDEECIICLNDLLVVKKTAKRIYLIIRSITPKFLSDYLRRKYFQFMPRMPGDNAALIRLEERRHKIRGLLDRIDMFIVPSRYARDRFMEFGISQRRMRLLSSGVDAGLFEVTDKIPSRKLRFGFIGTLLPAKGVHVLLEAFHKVKGEAELKIYGKLKQYIGFEYYLPYLKRIAKDKRIRFMGEFKHAESQKIFKELDVLAVPSIWNENAPLVIQEAFASKTPVIASRIGGIPELVSDGVDGILFQPGDIEGLYHKMQLLVSQPDIIDKLKRNISQVKNISDHAKEIEEIYSGLLTAKSYLS
jgi:glycosyltransferase involved in cell wall biosynthesis